ncbi:MAG: F420-dependent methylenetetrahydromethanopterin dehydrogenase [Candidatus Thorarchaeota archaeon]|nr:MAG: F420-dependent methylenetetrahydromethanopterin dehydrogenase [Candidatus Thorarchaeota archaeon]RLI53895.1 MAG: F420-dependent methylenetetrahydromethanopterin dehydrogenase [Candidatus Thorarchaeota archaeon]
MSDSFRLGILKLGCIGAAPLLDLILDERAERKDLDVRVVTTGASMDPAACEEVTAALAEMHPGLVLIVSPNASLPGPSKAREILLEKNIPILSISDGPSKKAFYTKDEKGKRVVSVPDGSGFIVLPMDPMIGARKEFLDPTETAIFNAELIKVLSCTGVVRFLQTQIDGLIEGLKAGETPKLPTVTVSTKKALAHAEFSNPYAYAKAYAALKMAESVADITSRACFKEKDPEVYVPAVAAGHELLRAAARLADEARELEKENDSVLRTPHDSSGKKLKKTKLHEKPA